MERGTGGWRSIAAAALLALAYSACLFLLMGGYAIDDSWIHLQFARNLASGAGLRFDPSAPPVYACSSPLWVFLLAPAYFAGVGGITMARLLSSLGAGACVFMAWRLAREADFKPLFRIALPLFVALDPWMIRWGSSGMESSLAAFLVICWMLAAVSERKHPAAAGLAAGLAFLTRPELAFLGALTPLFAGGGLRRIMNGLIPWMVIVSTWLAAAHTVFGTFLPAAVHAKVQSGRVWEYLLGELPGFAGGVVASHGMMLLVLTAGISKARWADRSTKKALLPIVVPLVLLAVLIAGRAPLVTRYFLPVLPVLSFVALSLMRTGMLLPKRHLVTFVVCTATWQVAAWGMGVQPHMAGMSANLEVYHEVAGELGRLTPQGSLIAVHEIGIFGYESGRRLLDLGGLVSPQVTPASYPGITQDAVTSIEFLREQGVTHYLDPHGAIPPLIPAEDRLGVRFVPLGSWDFPGGTSLSAHRSYTRTLYRLDWSDRMGRDRE